MAAERGSEPEGHLSGTPIPADDLLHPAQLTVWPNDGAVSTGVEPRAMPSLREALDAAFAVLRTGTGTPWILTDGGLIFTPAHLRGLMPQEPDAGEALRP